MECWTYRCIMLHRLLLLLLLHGQLSLQGCHPWPACANKSAWCSTHGAGLIGLTAGNCSALPLIHWASCGNLEQALILDPSLPQHCLVQSLQDAPLPISMLGLCQQVCRAQWITWRASWRCVKSLRVLTLRSASSSSWLMSVCRLRICTTYCVISHCIQLCTAALNSCSDG